MSLQSKWRQFVSWVKDNQGTSYDAGPNPSGTGFQSDDAYSWMGLDQQAAQTNLDANQGNLKVAFLQYIDAYTGWLDSKLSGQQPPNKIVTSNPDTDGIVITGVILFVAWTLFKKLFS